jgi:hypothetical protein
MKCHMPELVGPDLKFLHTGAYNDRPDYPTGMLCMFGPAPNKEVHGFLRTPPVLP